MKSLLTILVLISMVKSVHAQFPFEKFAPAQYTSFNNWKTYDKTEKEKKIHSTLTIPTFFDNGDTLTIQLTSFTDHWWNNSIIRIFRNKTEIQK
ncbi:MAG: hypothetical protein O9262_12790, partial [Cyclobacteriaceae bacterium]|nr:hypothetical protein [Cyclobacteriaceae bacterium]